MRENDIVDDITLAGLLPAIVLLVVIASVDMKQHWERCQANPEQCYYECCCPCCGDSK